MWTKPLQNGGVVGGNNFAIQQGDTFFEGSAYSQRHTNPIIVNGKLYYTEPVSYTGTTSGPTDCVDLRTGKLIWSRNDVPALSFAYLYDVQDPNQHGVYPAILCTANFARCFDADTGDPLFNVTGVPTASLQMQKVNGPNGEQLRYYMSNTGPGTNWTLAEWNSTKLLTWSGNSPAAVNVSNGVSWSMTGSVNNPLGVPGNYVSQALVIDGSVSNTSSASCRNDWNVTIPWRNTMPSAPTIVYCAFNDIMLCYNGTLPSQGAQFMGTLGFMPYTYFAVNLNASRGNIGDILWMKNYDPPAGNLTVLFAGVDPVNRVFTENLRETNNFVGYNLDTGAKLWTTTPQTTMDYYGSPASGSISNTFAYGRLYSSAYGGVVYCYDTKTGNVIWTFGNGDTPSNSTNSGFEVPGHYPTFLNAIGNGIVYTVSTEHTPETPIYKGALSRALNATDGTQIWTLSSYVGEFSAMSYAIADGYANWFNGYDNQLYTIGRGPTQLTVQAPSTSLDMTKSVVITGRVSDISSGTTQDEQAMRFPNGVPCASDAIMCDWMGYVYQQQPMPTNFTGVNVSIDVIDSNNNLRNIGTATTDSSGTYRLAWTPDIAGNYTVIATFQGTNGYWPSTDETGFVVDNQAQASTAPTAQVNIATTGDLMTYIVAAAIAIIIVIAIVGVLTISMLRKKA